MPDGRAFIALDPLKGLADLELAIADRLEQGRLGQTERQKPGRLSPSLAGVATDARHPLHQSGYHRRARKRPTLKSL